MFARHRQLFLTGIFLLDGLLILGSWVAAYWIRFRWLDLPAPLGIPSLERYVWFGAVVTPLALLVLRSFHLYRSARTARLSQELWTLVQGIAIVTALAALASYFLRASWRVRYYCSLRSSPRGRSVPRTWRSGSHCARSGGAGETSATS